MFDIGFTELLLISIVALLVLGPDKLPQAVRVTALWVGRARRSFNKVKSEIEEQLNADEIRRELHNESIMADLDEARKKARKLGDDTRRSFEKVDEDVRNTIHDGAMRDGILRKGNEPASSGEESDNKQETSSEEPPEGEPRQAADEDRNNREQETGGEQKESSATDEEPGKQEPVTDFYNNPGGRIVSLKGGNFASAEHPDEVRDEGEREGQQDSSGEGEGGQTGSRHDDKE